MSVKEAPILELAFAKVKPAAYNPRKAIKAGDPLYEQIKRSFELFGNVGGMVWNKRSGNLVGGHQRFQVLQDLGVKKGKFAVVDLAAKEEKALNITLNHLDNKWDATKLGEIVEELKGSEFIGGFEDELQELVGGGPGKEPKVVKDSVSFEVIISCKNEKEQEQVYDKIQKMGYDARVLTL